MVAPLDGIRILDMAWQGPGAFCATMLGDLGAEVIKVYEARPERRRARADSNGRASAGGTAPLVEQARAPRARRGNGSSRGAKR